MLLLLILADDFTGALDTGVQFAACGIPTRVVVGEQVDFAANDAAVLVVDTETRHLPAAEAYAVIAKLPREAMSAGVFSIYKKTDSALRGNIGAELSALLKTSGERQLPFLPAFPQIARVTRDGVHYISGVPVTERPFGIDPFEPVRHARVTELIGEQTDVPAHSFPTLKEGEAVPEQEGILVFDAGSLDDLASTGRALFQNGKPRLMAGCAGFAALLPDLMKMTERRTVTMPKLDPRLLVVCGSVNSITLRQLDVAEQNGFSAPLTAGIKLRAKVVGGDAISKAFLAATNRVGLSLNYDSQQLTDYRIGCVGTAFRLYKQMGEPLYCETMRLIVAAWEGKPDSFRASVLKGMMHFVELYHGEFSEERLLRALRNIHPVDIYRIGQDDPAKLRGWKKYVFPIYTTYNGKCRKDALPMKF